MNKGSSVDPDVKVEHTEVQQSGQGKGDASTATQSPDTKTNQTDKSSNKSDSKTQPPKRYPHPSQLSLIGYFKSNFGWGNSDDAFLKYILIDII